MNSCFGMMCQNFLLCVLVVPLVPVAQAQVATDRWLEDVPQQMPSRVQPPEYWLGLEIGSRVEALIGQLSDDAYHVRKDAYAELQSLTMQPNSIVPMAKQLQKALLEPAIPFETRVQLRKLHAQLPTVPFQRELTQPKEEIQRWVELLDSEHYASRVGAQADLAALLSQPSLIGPVVTSLKDQLAKADLTVSQRKRLVGLYDQAFHAWLRSEPSTWQLPPFQIEPVNAAIDTLARIDPDTEDPAKQLRWQIAEREVRFALARDSHVQAVEAALQKRLEDPELAPEAASTLRRLAQWCRPAMVAEIWQLSNFGNRVHRWQTVAQYLYIGVPWRNPDTPDDPRSSHFDYCDDEVCHCAEGYTLPRGEYPVGSAFAHPSRPDETLFFVVNLPNPRRRMLFDYKLSRGYDLPGNQEMRLREITKKTCDDFLSGKRTLDTESVMMLNVLDPHLVSKFAAEYLAKKDPPGNSAEQEQIDLQLCYQVLLRYGTADCLPGIVAAIENDRLPGIGPNQPYNVPWMVALTIAQKHPGIQSEAWLAEQMERPDKLVFDQEADVGATAAGMLLKQHPTRLGVNLNPAQIDPLRMRWVQTNFTEFPTMYRFTSVEARRELVGWWMGQAKKLAKQRDDGYSKFE